MPEPRPCRVFPVAAALCAVALGAGLSACSTAPKHTVRVTAAASPEAGIETELDELDQTPDFYVWLASGEADLIAME